MQHFDIHVRNKICQTDLFKVLCLPEITFVKQFDAIFKYNYVSTLSVTFLKVDLEIEWVNL